MFTDTWETVIVLDRLEKTTTELKNHMIDETAKRLVEVAMSEDFAADEDDFDTAVHVDGPDGDHALFAVEEQLAEIMRNRPAMIDVMRDSIEWETTTFNDDAMRAARALVNESFDAARKVWVEAHQSPTP